MNNKKILAVVGMCGAGKSEAVKHLQEKLNCPCVYFGEATFDRMKTDGLELNYKNEQITREKIRAEIGMGAYATLALPKINSALEKNDICIVESLYSWSEYKILKEEYGDAFMVMAVYASPATRFKRMTARDNERPIKSMGEFLRRDYSEIENIEKGGPIARADFLVYNEKGLKELKIQLNKIIKTFGGKA